jgi:hypothetical protein
MNGPRQETMESKRPSPVPLPAWERVRVRAARWFTSGILEGEHTNRTELLPV